MPRSGLKNLRRGRRNRIGQTARRHLLDADLPENQGDAKCPAASDDGWGPVFITFGADGRVNGMSGVNFFGGSCKIGGDGAAEFSQMFSTRRMGPFIDYEGKFLSALAQTDRISLSGGELVFFKGTDALAKFRQIENPKEK